MEIFLVENFCEVFVLDGQGGKEDGGRGHEMYFSIGYAMFFSFLSFLHFCFFTFLFLHVLIPIFRWAGGRKRG